MLLLLLLYCNLILGANTTSERDFIIISENLHKNYVAFFPVHESVCNANLFWKSIPLFRSHFVWTFWQLTVRYVYRRVRAVGHNNEG